MEPAPATSESPADTDLRLKDAEVRLKEIEVALKQRELEERRGWRAVFASQLTPILLTALFGLLATQANSFFTSRANLAVEREKAKSALITKMVETSDPAISARNLKFLLDAGLIDDPTGKIRNLANDKQAPVLSSSNGAPIEFGEQQQKRFVDLYRTQVGQIDQPVARNLKLILDQITSQRNLTEIPQAAYVLATIEYETGGKFDPPTEMGSRSYLVGRYGPSSRFGKMLGNQTDDDAVRYRGRGYIQLTGRANYEKMNAALHLAGTPDDLVTNPDAMLKPAIAYRATVVMMLDGRLGGTKLSNFVSGDHKDYVNARRVMGGLDHAAPIAENARKFEQMIAASLQTR